VLTAAQLEAAETAAPTHRVRSLTSLVHQYRAYVMQRIEDYKENLPREALLSLGDEAALDLQRGKNEQLLLTDVMMQETVDQQIIARLKLPSFRKWRTKILPLRKAQRQPTHWGINGDDPVATALPVIEPQDKALVIGGGADRAAYLLAAHDLEICCLVENTSTATRLEGTLASEALSGQCEVFVVVLGVWAPPQASGPFHLVVIDAAAVAALPQPRQRALLVQAQQRTAPGGLHALVSSDGQVAPEACLTHYPDWRRDPLPHTRSTARTAASCRGILLGAPPVLPSALVPLP
jgi:hypothetical protein